MQSLTNLIEEIRLGLANAKGTVKKYALAFAVVFLAVLALLGTVIVLSINASHCQAKTVVLDKNDVLNKQIVCGTGNSVTSEAIDENHILVKCSCPAK